MEKILFPIFTHFVLDYFLPLSHSSRPTRRTQPALASRKSQLLHFNVVVVAFFFFFSSLFFGAEWI